MSRTPSYYDVRDTLAEASCAVCRLQNRAVERYLDGLLWESVNRKMLGSMMSRRVTNAMPG